MLISISIREYTEDEVKKQIIRLTSREPHMLDHRFDKHAKVLKQRLKRVKSVTVKNKIKNQSDTTTNKYKEHLADLKHALAEITEKLKQLTLRNAHKIMIQQAIKEKDDIEKKIQNVRARIEKAEKIV